MFALMWLVDSRNKFLGVVKIFQKNSFRGEPILGGFNLRVTDNRMCVCVGRGWGEGGGGGGGSVQNCFAMPGFHEEKCLEC